MNGFTALSLNKTHHWQNWTKKEAAWRKLTQCVILWVEFRSVKGWPRWKAWHTALRFPFPSHNSQEARVRCWEPRKSSPRWPGCSRLLHFCCCPCGYSCPPGLCDGASPPVVSSSLVAAVLASVCSWPEREDCHLSCLCTSGRETQGWQMQRVQTAFQREQRKPT